MTKALKAIYENGVLRPLEPVDFEEHQTLTLIVSDAAKDARPVQGESCLDIAERLGLVGAIDEGPADLSTNQAYFEQFGRE